MWMNKTAVPVIAALVLAIGLSYRPAAPSVYEHLRSWLADLGDLRRPAQSASDETAAWPEDVEGPPPTGAQTTGRVSRVIYVDNRNPAASDQNPGTGKRPLKTIGEAAIRAVNNKRAGIGTKVLISPGTYREQLKLPTNYDDRDNMTPIVFEAVEKRRTIISGSDVWDGWAKQTGAADIYTHEWPYRWGFAPVPKDIPSPWSDSFKRKPLGQRREMIFIDGAPMKQVLSGDQLVAGSFYVDEAKRAVYLRPPAGLDPNAATVEVAVRPSVLYLEFARNITLRGLVFQHANDSLNPDYYNPGGADTNKINNSSDVLLEDIQFIWNNGNGIGLTSSSNITVRRTVANHNGTTGMGAWKLKNIVFEETETSFNNWRGDMSDYRDWSVAGLKFLAVHDGIFRRHVSTGNQARAFWLDFDNTNVALENCSFHGNLVGGIFIEASWGPIRLRRSVICHNDGPGVLASAAARVTLEKNILYGNRGQQILVSGDAGGREVSNWETQRSKRLVNQNWTITDNVIAGADASQPLFEFPSHLPERDWQTFISTLSANRNLYYSRQHQRIFKIRQTALRLADWTPHTGQDTDSGFADPRFRAPERDDYEPLPGSPLTRAGAPGPRAGGDE
jgi:hypothetical protein